MVKLIRYLFDDSKINLISGLNDLFFLSMEV